MSNSLYWISPSGVTTNLDDGIKYKALMGKSNFLAPPVTHIEDKIPQGQGSVLRWVNVEPRTIDVPIIVYGTDYTDMMANLRALASQFDPTEGTGELRFRIPANGTYQEELRSLHCTYKDGLVGNEGDSESFVVWTKLMLSFQAHDPYFYSSTGIEWEFPLTTDMQAFLGENFMQFRLTADQAITQQDINNGGVIPTYPTWNLYGPFTNISIINNTTSKFFTLEYVIKDGQYVEVNTSPTEKTVTLVDDTNRTSVFGYLTNTSTLFPLPKGVNDIEIAMTPYGETGSPKVEVKFFNKWITL